MLMNMINGICMPIFSCYGKNNLVPCVPYLITSNSVKTKSFLLEFPGKARSVKMLSFQQMYSGSLLLTRENYGDYS